MKKRLISDNPPDIENLTANWLDLGAACMVEITTEDANYPIEGVLLPNSSRGWKAGSPGTQKIRLLFVQPQDIHHIQLCFVETEVERTQEYVLSWSKDNGHTYREIIRQQWNFSPEGSTTELEDHSIPLSAVTALELAITPDISGQNAIATLDKLRIA
jgi:hypothetical protein